MYRMLRRLCRIALVLLFGWFGVCALLAAAIFTTGTIDRAVRSDVIIVLGAALTDAFVRRQRILLYVLTFLAAFTWPAAYYQGLVLTVWEPFRSPPPARPRPTPASRSSPSRTAWARRSRPGSAG